ncbi:MAG: hypothetical protein U1F77_01125 [Kiritimatiellia bacterium]
MFAIALCCREGIPGGRSYRRIPADAINVGAPVFQEPSETVRFIAPARKPVIPKARGRGVPVTGKRTPPASGHRNPGAAASSMAVEELRWHPPGCGDGGGMLFVVPLRLNHRLWLGSSGNGAGRETGSIWSAVSETAFRREF